MKKGITIKILIVILLTTFRQDFFTGTKHFQNQSEQRQHY